MLKKIINYFDFSLKIVLKNYKVRICLVAAHKSVSYQAATWFVLSIGGDGIISLPIWCENVNSLASISPMTHSMSIMLASTILGEVGGPVFKPIRLCCCWPPISRPCIESIGSVSYPVRLIKWLIWNSSYHRKSKHKFG